MATKKQASPYMGPFLTKSQAADYVGYAPSTFEKKVREDNIPKYGCGQPRFAIRDLDAWMCDPLVFRAKVAKKRQASNPKPLQV